MSSMMMAATSSSSASTPSLPLNDVSNQNDELLWKLDIDGVKSWIRRIHVLLPTQPKPRMDMNGQPLIAGSIRGGTSQYVTFWKCAKVSALLRFGFNLTYIDSCNTHLL